MKKLAIAGFMIFFCQILLFGQANRVKVYSESAPEEEKAPNKRKPPPVRETSGEPEKPREDVLRVDTDLVIIPARISDNLGKRVSDLKKEEFKIFEDEAEQELAFFSDQEQPFTVALILDMSYSSVFKLQEIQEAALAFIDELRPLDKVMIVSFDEEVRVLCEPTGNRRVLRLAVEATKIASGSSVYLALDKVIEERLNSFPGRKAIVLLSDGVDTTSRTVRSEKVFESIGESDILVFPIQYDTYADVQKSRKKTAQIFYDEDDRPYTVELPKIKGERAEDYKIATEFLNDLSAVSGGKSFRVSISTNLKEAFAFIADELRKIYSLGYYPSVNSAQGISHKIRVRVYRPNLNIRAKTSYLRRRK